MCNTDYTHLSVLVDRSGSMSSLRDDMLGGLKSLFADQAGVDGKCLVDYAQFDTEYEQILSNALVASAEPVLEPRGGTALLDALGRSINELHSKIKALPKGERPANVIFIVVTDGYENSSREFNKKQIADLIKTKESELEWDFVFLGANMDAVAESSTMGMKKGSTLTYTSDTVGATYANVSSYVTRSRSGVIGNAFTEEERAASVAPNS